MNKITLAATSVLLMLAGCSGTGDGEANDMVAGPTNLAEPVNAADGGKDPADDSAGGGDAAENTASGGEGARATAASPSGEIRALLIGRWTDSGDCASATEFRADGSFTSPVGAGRWTLESEYLTLSGAGPDDAEVAIQEIDRREMATISPTGRIGRWTRC